ncbi:MAG TPA: hypothetical protein VFN41_09530 [Candidatus Limnocylindrales bacterium]|nr:hypothetical protein [Candidatus Limnocylindrales bacterium]
MSLFRIETCFVPAAALPEAAGDPASLALALALAAGDPPLLAGACELQAAATSAMTAISADSARDHRRVSMVCTETALLLVRQ